MKKIGRAIASFPALLLLMALWGCAGSGLTTAEWLTHAQLSTVGITKGDVWVTEGIRKKDYGDYEGALEKWAQAVSFFREAGRAQGQADALCLIGSAHLELNRYEEALRSFGEASDLADRSRLGDSFARTLIGLSSTYAALGDSERAMANLEKALLVAEQASDGKSQMRVLNGMAALLLRESKFGEALSRVRQALAIASASRDEAGMRSSRYGIGTALGKMGRYAEALEQLRPALVSARKDNDLPAVVDALNAIGFCRLSLGDGAGALSVFEEGLSLAAAFDLNFPEKRVQALYGAGRVYEKRGDSAAAAVRYRDAIEELETLRGSIGGAEYRVGFFEDKIAIFESLVDLLAAGDTDPRSEKILRDLAVYGRSLPEAAFFFAESTRARSFLESLASAKQASFRAGLPKEIVDRERNISSRLLSLQAGGSGRAPDERGGAFSRRRELAAVRAEMKAFVERLRSEHPEYAAIRYPAPVAAGEVPLRAGEILLAYKVHDHRSYLWILRRDAPLSLLSIHAGRAELSEKIAAFREGLLRPGSTGNPWREKGLGLYNLLLAPALGGTSPGDRILIVPDGPLHLLPFEALTAGTSSPAAGAAFAGDRNEFAYYPSASILRLARSVRTERPAPPLPLFALGDPVYDRRDPRFAQRVALRPDMRAAADRTAPDAGAARYRDIIVKSGFLLPRLPETGEEVVSIARLFGYGEDSPHIRIGLDATKDALGKTDLGGYRYLHFATHGILSGEIPYLREPAIVLTQVGEGGGDGLLRASDVLGMNLRADLVALSACKTALGREVAGEGVVGLGRAFMLAGARAAVVSLWSVESESTTRLMISFYRHLTEGKRAGEALRAAKREIREGAEGMAAGRVAASPLPAPFFWAPFILVGEAE